MCAIGGGGGGVAHSHISCGFEALGGAECAPDDAER